MLVAVAMVQDMLGDCSPTNVYPFLSPPLPIGHKMPWQKQLSLRKEYIFSFMGQMFHWNLVQIYKYFCVFATLCEKKDITLQSREGDRKWLRGRYKYKKRNKHCDRHR